MSNKLTVTGKQDFMGIEIPVVLGGFGPKERCICDKTAAKIHGMETKNIRARITDNIERFDEYVDYIDLKKAACQTSDFTICSQLGYSRMEMSKAENIYVLSRRGYFKLVKILKTDEAWDVYNQLLDSYFIMEQRTSSAIAAEKRATAMVINAKNRVADRMQKLYMQADVKPEYQILALQDYFGDDGIYLPRIALKETKVTYDKGTIAEKLGVYSKTGIPHAQVIGAIIKRLDILDEEKEAVPYHRNGHDGTDYQYTQSVIDKVEAWLAIRDWPSRIEFAGKIYKVAYGRNQSQGA